LINILDDISKKVVKISALSSLIKNYNYDKTSNFIVNDSGDIILPLEEKILHLYSNVYKKLNLDVVKNKKILDLGSGFCHNNIICKILNHKCYNIEMPPKEHIQGHISNLYKYFHKILKLKNVEYYDIKSPVVNFKTKILFDYIFIIDPTFNESEKNNNLNIWNVDDWKIFFKCLHKNLLPNGKIIIGWNKGKISDLMFNSDWNNYRNSKALKYIENKYIDYFEKNKDYRAYTYNDLNSIT